MENAKPQHHRPWLRSPALRHVKVGQGESRGCGPNEYAFVLSLEHEVIALVDGAFDLGSRFASGHELIVLRASDRFWQNTFDAAGVHDPAVLSRLVGRLCQDRYLGGLIRRMYREGSTGGPNADSQLRRSCIVVVVTFLGVVLAANREPSERGLRPSELEVVLHRMETDLSEPLRVEQLAQAVALSPSRFSRSFKRTMKRTPYQYLLQMRLLRAMEMLVATQEPLATIAVDCGFFSQAHMTRLFKRRYGMPPGRYRRELESTTS